MQYPCKDFWTMDNIAGDYPNPKHAALLVVGCCGQKRPEGFSAFVLGLPSGCLQVRSLASGRALRLASIWACKCSASMDFVGLGCIEGSQMGSMLPSRLSAH